LVGFPVLVSVSRASSGLAEIEISPRGTYLRADSGGEGVDPPSVVDLQTNGFSGGDTILISFNGSINVYGTTDYDTIESLIGVFSSNNTLLSISVADRVPGAIDAGNDISTPQTYFTHENTDIPEDFQITPSTGFSIKVPQNAKYLFIAYCDSYYPDNKAPAPINVTIQIQASESSTGGFPLEYVLVALGVVAIIAVLLVFVLFKRRKPRTQSNPA